jgi:hypothetical protein
MNQRIVRRGLSVMLAAATVAGAYAAWHEINEGGIDDYATGAVAIGFSGSFALRAVDCARQARTGFEPVRPTLVQRLESIFPPHDQA